MPSLEELHALLSQAERTVQARASDLADAQDHQEQVALDCFMDPYDKTWRQAKQATKRAHEKYERALREAEKLRRAIRNGVPPREYTFQAHVAPPSQELGVGSHFQVAVTRWREQCVACFTDYAALQVFPVPPINRPCIKQGCRREDRALAVCKCQIQHAFNKVEGLNLKKERTCWHPDKFSACANKDVFQAMAKEIFIVVDEMYRQS